MCTHCIIPNTRTWECERYFQLLSNNISDLGIYASSSAIQDHGMLGWQPPWKSAKKPFPPHLINKGIETQRGTVTLPNSACHVTGKSSTRAQVSQFPAQYSSLLLSRVDLSAFPDSINSTPVDEWASPDGSDISLIRNKVVCFLKTQCFAPSFPSALALRILFLIEILFVLTTHFKS